MNLKIGKFKNSMDVYIADSSTNQHISIVGISGSGKSTRIKEIILSSFEMGNTVIVFDIGGMDYYPADTFKDLDGIYINRISAARDGINLQLLKDAPLDNRTKCVNFISYIVDIISGTERLGSRQRGALVDAVIYVAENASEYPSEMGAIAEYLKIQDNEESRSVHTKLWNVLECGILRNDGKNIEKNKVNIISFKGINTTSKKNLIEIVLASIWRTIRSDQSDMGNTSLILDEYQNLPLKPDSTLLEMLHESRKYGVNLVLSTQTVTPFKSKPDVMSAIGQAAVHLYFQPINSDINKIASTIGPNDEAKWVNTLRGLKIGESIALGKISINGMEIQHPIVIQSHYRGHEVKP